MEPANSTPTQPQPFAIDVIVPELLLALATAPLLAGLLGEKALAEALREIGVFSEEIFRGDRLPLLDFPAADPHQNPPPSI